MLESVRSNGPQKQRTSNADPCGKWGKVMSGRSLNRCVLKSGGRRYRLVLSEVHTPPISRGGREFNNADSPKAARVTHVVRRGNETLLDTKLLSMQFTRTLFAALCLALATSAVVNASRLNKPRLEQLEPLLARSFRCLPPRL
jgi:hypothetical protein